MNRVLLVALMALSAAQWQADISYLETELPKRHPNLFYRLPQSEFLAALENLKAHAGDYPDTEVVLRIQQVVARISDAHTEVDTRRQPQTYYPLRLVRFSDGIYVTKTTDASRAACAARLVAIEGIPADDVYERVATLVSHENDAWVTARFGSHMVRAETLAMLGVTSSTDHARFTFERSAGNPYDIELTPISASEASGTIFGAYGTDRLSPLYLRDAKQKYWYVFDAERHLLYVKYNVCANDEARPFDAFAREIFAIADRERVDRFVVDVRNNTGGSSAVAKPLIDGLVQRTQFRGRLYVIIGRETFSSGMLNALELQARAGAIVAGEPSGGKPNSYGEVKSFALPASGTNVYHSTKFFQIVPGDPPSILPDIPVALTSADFFAGRDPVLDSIAPPAAAPASVPAGRRRSVSISRACPQ